MDKVQIYNDTISNQLQRCKDVLISKSKEYQSEADPFINFMVAADCQRITPREALYGMMAKHTASLYSMKTGEYTKEMWDEKITDHINYLLLLRALVEVEKESEKSCKTVLTDDMF